MSGNLYGADPEALDALARMFEVSSERLRQIGNEVINRVHDAHWSGADAVRFEQDFTTVQLPKVRAAATTLEVMARSLTTNAREQRYASTARETGAALGAGILGGIGLDHPGGSTSTGVLGDDLTVDEDGLHVSHAWLDSQRGTGAGVDRKVSVNGLDTDANAGVFLGTKATAGSVLDVGPDGVSLGMSGAVQAGAEANAGIAATAGIATLSATGHAFAGGKASGNMKVGVGPDGVDATAGLNAMAGAEASATVDGNVGGVEGSVTGTAMAGVGVEAGGDVKVSADEIDVSFKIGASLGIGFGIEPSFSIHPQQVISSIAHLFGL